MNHRNTFGLGVATGLTASALLIGSATHADPQVSEPKVLLDETKIVTTYANAYRIHTSQEEVILDLGFNMPVPTPNEKHPDAALMFTVTDRIILNYNNTKRLSRSLAELIKRYEAQFGEISTELK
jgi:hypothetical protein